MTSLAQAVEGFKNLSKMLDNFQRVGEFLEGVEDCKRLEAEYINAAEKAKKDAEDAKSKAKSARTRLASVEEKLAEEEAKLKSAELAASRAGNEIIAEAKAKAQELLTAARDEQTRLAGKMKEQRSAHDEWMKTAGKERADIEAKLKTLNKALDDLRAKVA